MLFDSLKKQRCLVMLLLACLSCCAFKSVQAGCHYGHSAPATQSHNPREHARNFRFLGQWVYERGQIKYEPSHNSSKCEGPLCKSHAPELPLSTLAPVTTSQRSSTSIFIANHDRADDAPTLHGQSLDLHSEAAIELYQAVPLKPPRA